jgi:hypothetical protein
MAFGLIGWTRVLGMPVCDRLCPVAVRRSLADILSYFYALLATKAGEDVALLLAQHKGDDGLGMKTVASITVWYGSWDSRFGKLQHQDVLEHPHLLFEIRDLDYEPKQ